VDSEVLSLLVLGLSERTSGALRRQVVDLRLLLAQLTPLTTITTHMVPVPLVSLSLLAFKCF